jgi:hypothetical protein
MSHKKIRGATLTTLLRTEYLAVLFTIDTAQDVNLTVDIFFTTKNANIAQDY